MKRLEKKHPLAIRWFHWINFPVLFTMIWSGILIYWANDVYRIGLGNHTFFKFFPQRWYDKFHWHHRLGEGMAWHFVFAWIFAINGLCYVTYVALSGEWRELLPRRDTIAQAIQVVLHDLRIRKNPLPRAKFNGAQRIAYTGVVIMGFGSLITGLAIYKPIQTAGLLPFSQLSFMGATGYEIARWLHFWLTWAFCAFFLVHVAQVARAGWNNFRAMITGYEIVDDEMVTDEFVTDSPTPQPPVVASPVIVPTVKEPVHADTAVHPTSDLRPASELSPASDLRPGDA